MSKNRTLFENNIVQPLLSTVQDIKSGDFLFLMPVGGCLLSFCERGFYVLFFPTEFSRCTSGNLLEYAVETAGGIESRAVCDFSQGNVSLGHQFYGLGDAVCVDTVGKSYAGLLEEAAEVSLGVAETAGQFAHSQLFVAVPGNVVENGPYAVVVGNEAESQRNLRGAARAGYYLYEGVQKPVYLRQLLSFDAGGARLVYEFQQGGYLFARLIYGNCGSRVAQRVDDGGRYPPVVARQGVCYLTGYAGDVVFGNEQDFPPMSILSVPDVVNTIWSMAWVWAGSSISSRQASFTTIVSGDVPVVIHGYMHCSGVFIDWLEL